MIEKLIPLLKSRNIAVATIKHHDRDFDIDREGKDTYRHKKAGSRIAMIVSPKKLALIEDTEREAQLDEIVDRYIRDVGLVIVEGYKAVSAPKIEVYNYRDDTPPLALGDRDLLAIVSDKPMSAPVPVFLREDAEALTEFIVQKLGIG